MFHFHHRTKAISQKRCILIWSKASCFLNRLKEREEMSVYSCYDMITGMMLNVILNGKSVIFNREKKKKALGKQLRMKHIEVC